MCCPFYFYFLEGKGCPVGTFINDFKHGDFVVTIEGQEGSYGLYQVFGIDEYQQVGATGVGFAGLIAVRDSRLRCVLTAQPSDKVPDKDCYSFGGYKCYSSFVMHKGVMWGEFSGGVSRDPMVLGDVVRVFKASEREAAEKFFDTLIEANEAQGKPRSGNNDSLNADSSNLPVFESIKGDGVAEVYSDKVLAELRKFASECNKMLSGISFKVDKEAVEAFKRKTLSEVGQRYFKLFLPTNKEVGACSLGFLIGDIVRVETRDGVQFLQVIGGDGETVDVSNITAGFDCSLKIVSELNNEGCYDTYLHLVKPDGSDSRVFTDSFMILPTLNRVAMPDRFESIREAQEAELKKFSDAIAERLDGLEEATRLQSDSFVSSIYYSEMFELLYDINRLNCDATRSGDIARLQTLETQVHALVESKLETVRESVHELYSEVSEALTKVAALNAE